VRRRTAIIVFVFVLILVVQGACGNLSPDSRTLDSLQNVGQQLAP